MSRVPGTLFDAMRDVETGVLSADDLACARIKAQTTRAS